ncbi:MAG: type III-B CRISPR module RAMP protein Cmr6 [Methylotenera sp.]|jgi:CRISPR-associated protein Cmr6|uniref:type III-B CRISPR module RAMP protein Cmr6 n=1 Tax=Methylotenera sp. TaxID=2051956 RepID=UPI000D4037EE|nr:type III-B CRISPR module RAMP protein Cmr6 [Methylotenera sp.]PPC84001.1 MAG: type III-B CRISPR module RAMP protein Cmr6 [Methylotenera sp.]
MTQPLYKGVAHPQKMQADANAGLWFTRFFNEFDDKWTVGDKAKTNWIDTLSGKRGNEEMIAKMANSLSKLGASLGAEIRYFKTDWHFATGLGLSHPVENGFTWHQTLGVPYLPASGVKGLLRGWVEAWMDHDSDTDKHAMINRWFGAVENKLGAKENSAGNLIFFDAIPTKPVTLACDIMTPHMGKWYEKGGDIKSEDDYADAAPADWHSPVPVPFLVVKQANFRCMIAPRLIGDDAHDTQAKQDAKAAMEQLSLALQWIGAGAKTAAGYGRFTEDSPEAEARKKELQEQEKRKQQEESAELWAGVTIKFNRGNGTLEVTSKNNQKAYAYKENGVAESLLNTLLSATKTKILQNAYVKVNARVSGTSLLSVEDIPKA